MKWIEISYKNARFCRLINASKIDSIIHDGSEIELHTGIDTIYVVLSSIAEGKIIYDQIKSYCMDYGPTPNGLTIESE